MGHLTTKDAYKNLEERINWFTQGAPPSESLYKILQVLYTEKEAKWVALLPVRPFTLKKAAKIWNTTEAKAEKLLDHLCEKALLVDSFHKGVRKFVMPPPMAGFIEFALMRTRGDIDQKLLSELYYQYMNVEEDMREQMIMPLILQTFVGNSIKHNVNLVDILKVKVDIRKQEEKIHIVINDNGVGFPDAVLDRINRGENISEDGEHIGICNVKERLKLLYSDKGCVHISSRPGESVVTVILPVII